MPITVDPEHVRDPRGDPRDFKNLRQIIDWIELIPYAETRRVLENLQVYRSIISKNNNLKLKQDLLKTKDTNREIWLYPSFK